MYTEKGLNKNAQAFFNSTQWHKLNSFFEQHGETVQSIFKNTTSTSGVMVLFIVINGLTKTFKDFLLNMKHETRNINLLPTSFDRVLLKQYQKLRTKREYVLKCKICDFISYTTYTMEHMAFVHNIHYGFGLTTNISDKLPPKDVPTIKDCIFQTPNSENCHLFSDHFTKITSLRFKKLDVHFNNRNNPLSKCFFTYISYLEQNGKIYTIEKCEHENYISSLKTLDLECCSCMKKTMNFYKRFHAKLFDLFKIVGLTQMRSDRFESRDSIKWPQHTKKVNIFKKFQYRIEKMCPDFFTSDNNDKCPTILADVNDNSVEIITENNDMVIVIDGSNSSHEDTLPRVVPTNPATQTSIFGIQNLKGAHNLVDGPKGSIFGNFSWPVDFSSDTKSNIIKIEEVESKPPTKTSTLYKKASAKIGKEKSSTQSKSKVRSSILKKNENRKKLVPKSSLNKIRTSPRTKSIGTCIRNNKTKKSLRTKRNLKSPTIDSSINMFETWINQICKTEPNKTTIPAMDTDNHDDDLKKPIRMDLSNPDEASEQETVASFLNKHSNDLTSDSFKFPVEYTEGVVEDSTKISNKVRNFEKLLFDGRLQCDPIREYKDYKKYDSFLSMVKKTIGQQSKTFKNESSEEFASSFLKYLDLKDEVMDVVQHQAKLDYKDILNKYSTAQKLNCVFLDELNNPNVGSAIFRDILNECADSVTMQANASTDMKPFIINVPANFKANCNTLANRLILLSINTIIEKKPEIGTKEIIELLSLLSQFVSFKQNFK